MARRAAPRTGPLDDGEKEGSSATAVDVSDPAAAPAAVAEAAVASSGVGDGAGAVGEAAGAGEAAPEEEAAARAESSAAAAAEGADGADSAEGTAGAEGADAVATDPSQGDAPLPQVEGGRGEEGEVFPVWEGPAVPPTVPPSPLPSPPSSPPPLLAAATEGGAARQQGELESVAVSWLACDCEGGDGMLSGVIDLLRGQRGSLVN